jgi:diguanylate cyclase (GGDEF)-like protein/PAS domain S-box-containing protein
MVTQERRAERWIAAALAVAVLGVGLVASCLVYSSRSGAHRQRVSEEFQDAARHYSYLVQRQLDDYADTNRGVAAYVSATRDLDAAGMSTFIQAGHYFDRLNGIRSFGYLPRVTRQQVAAFERQAGKEFPGYRIRDWRPGAQVLYPLLYSEHVKESAHVVSLQGVDFLSIPERREAIEAAEDSDAPAASHVHISRQASKLPPAMVTFTPVRRGAGAGGKGAVTGMVYAAMGVRDLFEGVDHGAIGRMVDLEVYEDAASGGRLVYDADGIARAGAPEKSGQQVYVGGLRYADRQWQLYCFAKPEYLAAHRDGASWMVLAIGALLSLIAAYAAFRFAHHLVARQTGAQLSERFEAFFDAHPFGVYAMDRERRLGFVNQKMMQELGGDRASLIGSTVERFIIPENKEMAASYFQQALDGNAVAYNNTIVNAHGLSSELAIVLIPIRNGGEVTRVLGFAENISERKRFEKELYESRQMLQHILDTVPQRVFWKDRDGVYLGANRRLLEEAGLARIDELVGRTDDELVWRGCAQRFREEDLQVIDSAQPLLNIQQSLVQPDGSVSWYEVNKVPLTDNEGTVVGVLGVSRDITENKRLEQELLHRANYDSLTALPNRAFFYSELQLAIKRAQRNQGIVALMYFDIDRFKLINDRYGHDVGDVVIRTFAARVRGALRQCDFVARLGGDEFVLIVEELASRADAVAVAEKLIGAMRAPFRIGDRSLDVSTSIGIAMLEEGMRADELVKAADDAMYEAKRAGRNCFRAVAAST